MKIKCSKCGQAYKIEAECSNCSSISSATISDFTSNKIIHPKYNYTSGKRYLFKKKLGSGGNGEIYEFEDTTLTRLVAVKIPLESMRNDILLQEARIGGFLEHPNILPVYDIGTSSDRSCFVMRKFEEKSNFYGLRNESQIKILQAFLQVCYGVSYAHSKQIIHFDLKCENILLGHHGEVVIVDWGLSSYIDNIKTKFSLGVIVGTPQYMSPEQASGNPEKYSIACDIYSLGMTLYKTIATKNLLMGLTTQQTISKVLSPTENVIPIKKPPHISKQLYSIVKKATAYNSKQRYLNVNELIQDIESYLKQEDGIAFKQNVFRKIYSLCKKYPRFFACSVLLMAFLLAASYFMQSRHFEAQVQGQKALKMNNAHQAVQAYTIASTILPWKTTANEKVLQEYILFKKQLRKIRFSFFYMYYLEENIKNGLLTVKQDPKTICQQAQEKLEYINQYLSKCNSEVKQFINAQYLEHRKAEIILIEKITTLKKENAHSLFQNILTKHQLKTDEHLSLILHFSTKNWDAVEETTKNNVGFYWGYLLQSIRFAQEGKMEQSSLAITPCLVLKPHDPLPYFVMSFFSRNEKDLSFAHLYKASQIAPNDPMVHFHIANLHYYYQNFSKAQEHYNKVIESEPKFVGGYHNRGNTWIHKKHSQKAISDFQKAIELVPHLASSYNGMGQAYRLDKKWKLAIINYKKAAKLNPKYKALSYSNCGNIYFDQNKYQQALDYYQKSLSVDSKFIEAYFNLAITYAKLGQIDLAINFHSKTIELDKEYLFSYIERAILYKQQKMFSKSINDYKYALKLDPYNAKIYYNKAVLFEEMGKDNEAILNYEKALKLDSEHVKSCYNYAVLQHKQRNFSVALIYYNKAIKNGKLIYHFFYQRAQVYVALNQISSATTDYLKVIEMEKNHLKAHYMLARIYSMTNKPEQACNYLQRCMQLNKNYKRIIQQDRFFQAIKKHPMYKKLMFSTK
ncbi:tetratricopeptide repeat protein [Candidatus Uabimicrobium sp. HlEnr_7]|uniref:tetratricopeptide repeat protein n=1 Tax=Candidatus Uabimicrobium helgolandensis TaxID=3095367 RepID=UPI0035582522